MMSTPSYRKAFYFALGLHLFLMVMLLTDSSTSRPVLTMESKNTPGMEQPVAAVPQQEVVKAVSLDNKEVMKTVNRLKQEREQKQRAELNRQKELDRQLQQAKQQRMNEQQNLARLKEEANKIAIARKKQAEEEKKHLKQLAEQKALEARRIEELKKQKEQLVKQQELEVKKLAELNRKKAEEKAKAYKLKAEKAKAEKAAAERAKADMEKKKQAEEASAAQQARQNAENQARIAGEVDKYKALIVNAIGKNWILPENVDSSLSSQFRIRLAPNGVVLEVTLTRGSGDPLLDRSAQNAIQKASPLPVPTDAETFNLFRDISLTVRPEQVRG
jgi:colicin import membrane protein